MTSLQTTIDEPAQQLFTPGAQVRLIARREVQGVVVDVMKDGLEQRYRVFHDGGLQDYYGSQIESLPTDEVRDTLHAKAFHAGMTAAQLLHPTTRFLYSLNAGRIDFEAYQYRPVLKLIQADRPRLLIADDVGVGKTIEARLIIKELQARQDLESILIICPKPLVSEQKWKHELQRFDEDFVHLNGETLRQCLEEYRLEGQWPSRYRKAIIPYSLLDERLLNGSEGRRPHPGLVDLDPPPRFDLLIVDEAHNIRNRQTSRYKNVEQLLEGSDAVVFLTATPIQTGNEDLFTLLNLMRPDLIPGHREFEQMTEPNPHLGEAAAAARAGEPGWQRASAAHLAEARATTWGQGVLQADPRMHLATSLLEDEGNDSEDMRVRAVRALEGLNTFSSLINRTRRRDIGEFTTRKPETVEVEFTPAQQDVYDKLIDLSRRIAVRVTPGMPVDFLLSTLQRQAASCLNGLAPLVGDLLARRLTPSEISEADGDVSEVEPELLSEFAAEIHSISEAAARLGDDDPKFEALETIVHEKSAMANSKLLLFTTFRHTITYLERRLEASGARIGVVHGGIDDEDRRQIRRRFKLPKEDPLALDVLLSSEVGTEGLDYQFCDALVNYDLPWNPMRVEQRIGRIDRRGQRSESIAIKNMITAGTVDAAIYHRCLSRIGVFQRALGGSEEILGELTREMRSIAENLSLTDEERDQRLRQLADNRIGHMQEQAALEEQQAQLFGLAVKESDDAGVEAATSPWLTPAKIADLVVTYLTDLDQGRKVSLTRTGIAVLRPTKELRARLLADTLDHSSNGQDARWEKWIRSSDSTRSLTVDSLAAENDSDIELLGPTHPLVRAAARHARFTGTCLTHLRIETSELPPGRYSFAVYGWTQLGVQDDFSLRIVAADAAHQDLLERLLPRAVDSGEPLHSGEIHEDQLESRQYLLWSEARADHQTASAARIRARRASLQTTHLARLAQLAERRAEATNERILRMRESQLNNLVSDYERRIEQLTLAEERCDLLTHLLAFGILEVTAP